MLIPTQFSHRKTVVILALGHLMSFQECRRNPYVESFSLQDVPIQEVGKQPHASDALSPPISLATDPLVADPPLPAWASSQLPTPRDQPVEMAAPLNEDIDDILLGDFTNLPINDGRQLPEEGVDPTSSLSQEALAINSPRIFSPRAASNSTPLDSERVTLNLPNVEVPASVSSWAISPRVGDEPVQPITPSLPNVEPASVSPRSISPRVTSEPVQPITPSLPNVEVPASVSPRAVSPRVSSHGAPVDNEPIAVTPQPIPTIANPVDSPVVEQTQSPALPTQPTVSPTLPVLPTRKAPEPAKPTIVITEKMVKNLPEGPLKIAVVQLKNQQKLREEGNRGILPVNLRTIGAKGFGPIHGAVNTGDPDLVHLILQEGDNVNRLGPNNNTPLHYAVLNEDKKVVEILLTYAPNKTLRNKEGETPADLAKKLFGADSPLYTLLQ